MQRWASFHRAQGTSFSKKALSRARRRGLDFPSKGTSVTALPSLQSTRCLMSFLLLLCFNVSLTYWKTQWRFFFRVGASLCKRHHKLQNMFPAAERNTPSPQQALGFPPPPAPGTP